MARKRTQALPQARKDVTPTLQIVVRRGALRRFALLNEKRGELPVAVVWDRRAGDRRTESDRPAGERRQAERRREPPFTWTAAEFVVVEGAPGPDPDNNAAPESKRRQTKTVAHDTRAGQKKPVKKR
jgi:hypothetical protein